MSLTTTDCRLPSSAAREAWAVRALAELDRAGVGYCVLRGGDQLRATSGNEEVDLLVSPRELGRVRRVLAGNGFVSLRVWGHAPHHFFVSYDPDADRWLKLDVVTRLAYGRPNHALETDLAGNCLNNRRYCDGVFIPSAGDEWLTLLLHCVLDKGAFTSAWQNRLRTLAAEVNDAGYVTGLIRRCWSADGSFEELREAVLAERWDALLASRKSVEQFLKGRHPFRTAISQSCRPALRKLHRLVRFIAPQAVSVAILAPDGAGKSTLASGIADHFLFPVEQVYMGLYQKAPTASASKAPPGLGFAGKILTQWSRYLSAQCHKARGRFVIFDRYTYDALLPSRRQLNWFQRVRRWLLAHACPAPDLTVVLDAPGEMLFARKGEHSPEYLEQHRQAYLALRDRFSRVAVVDATRDADAVRRDVTAHMWRTFARQSDSS